MALFSRPGLTAYDLIREIHRILNENISRIINTVKRPLLASWIGPTYEHAREAHGDRDIPPTRSIIIPAGDGHGVKYLIHERGLDWLAEKRMVPTWLHAQLDASAQRSAEYIAYATTEATAAKLAATLADSIRHGGNIRNFRQAVDAAFGSSPLSRPALETLYRTNSGRAFAAGQQYILSHPIVGDQFPYVLYSAVHDSRTEPTHKMMESLGLNGTAVYRADDPVIRKFWAPWRWNCRCACISISVADAAKHGCQEAIQWQKTGIPPAVPQYVKHPPFELPKGWRPVAATRFPEPVV
jgi:SPP1 gp7 family putative phage head morphogenesis protein